MNIRSLIQEEVKKILQEIPEEEDMLDALESELSELFDQAGIDGRGLGVYAGLYAQII